MKKFVEGTYKTPYRLKLNLQTFADGDDNDNTDDDKDDNGGDDKPFATFKTKDELNKRLDRATRKGQKELATSLGFDSVEALQAALKAEKKDDKEKSKKSDDDTDVDSLIEEKLKEQNQKTFQRLLNSEVKVLANELGFADWEDARALGDFSAAKESDKGEIEGVKEALETLAKKKPHLLKSKQGSGRIGADIGGGAPEDKKKRQDDIISLAKNRGTVGGKTAYDPWNKN